MATPRTTLAYSVGLTSQQRARDTHTALVTAAAQEFADHGYAGGSVNRILERSGKTKGALYFHFRSKEAIAYAVLDAAHDMHTAIGDRWRSTDAGGPLESLAALVADLAAAYDTEDIIRAELRLLSASDLPPRPHSSAGWEPSALALATAAGEHGDLHGTQTPPVMIRSLSVMLAGTRNLTTVSADTSSLTARFAECLDTVLAAAGATAPPTTTAATQRPRRRPATAAPTAPDAAALTSDL